MANELSLDTVNFFWLQQHTQNSTIQSALAKSTFELRGRLLERAKRIRKLKTMVELAKAKALYGEKK